MKLSTKQQIETKFMLAFEGKTARPEMLALLRERNIAGFTLFRPHNYESPEQIRTLTDTLQRAASEGGHAHLLIATDQEGGQLNAMGEGTTHFAGNMALGATHDPELARKVGRAIGLELAAMGVNVNYAPICDINTNPANPSLGIRAISDDPALTAEIAAALVNGLQSAGVAATLKHFPGKGAAKVDSHYQMPLIDHTRARLDAHELIPFKAALAAAAKLIMTGHFAIPALSGTNEVPATLSRAVMHDFLRGKLGFEGLVITDALDMGAIAQGAGQLIDVIAAARADVDLLLLTADQEVQKRLLAGLQLAYSRGLIADHHLAASAERIAALRQWMGTQTRPSPDVVGCPEHRALARELAERSITLVRDHAGLLPLDIPADARILVVMPEPKDLTPADTSSHVTPTLAAALRKHHPQVDEIITKHSPTDEEISAIKEKLPNYQLLIAGTLSASMNSEQAALVNTVLEADEPTITVALRTPYDLSVYPRSQTHLCTYSILPESMDALAAALWGKIPFQGRLPVQASFLER